MLLRLGMGPVRLALRSFRECKCWRVLRPGGGVPAEKRQQQTYVK
jgi:hypothetical protein